MPKRHAKFLKDLQDLMRRHKVLGIVGLDSAPEFRIIFETKQTDFMAQLSEGSVKDFQMITPDNIHSGSGE